MKHGWKNLLAITLMVASVAACSKKGGNASGGTAAAPPPATDTPATGNDIPDVSDQQADIKLGSWKGKLSIVDVAAYRKYLKQVGRCSGWKCKATNEGYLKLQFDVYNSRLPTRNTAMILSSKVKCENGNSYNSTKVTIKGRTAAGNSDNNGFQWKYIASGNYSNLAYFDEEDDAPAILAAWHDDGGGDQSLKLVTVYKNGDRTDVSARVFYKGVKIAEGELKYYPFEFDWFGDSYQYTDDDFDNYYGNGGWYWYGNERRPRRVRRNNNHVYWNNHNWNSNNFNFNAFVNGNDFDAYLRFSYNF